MRTFGSLINQILPVKVNAGGHLMHAVADRYMMPCETERYAAYGDLLMYAGIPAEAGVHPARATMKTCA